MDPKALARVAAAAEQKKREEKEAAIQAAFSRTAHKAGVPKVSWEERKRLEREALALKALDAERAKREKELLDFQKSLARDWLRTLAYGAAKQHVLSLAAKSDHSPMSMYATTSSYHAEMPLSCYTKERVAPLFDKTKVYADFLSSKFRVLHKDSVEAVLEPKDVRDSDLISGPRTTLYHGTSGFGFVSIATTGVKPTVREDLLLGPGFYLGKFSKASSFTKPATVLVEGESPYVESRVRFRGVMLEIEAVLGNIATVLTKHSDEPYQTPEVETLYGKAGVTPAGWGLSGTLRNDEWCVRPTAPNFQKRFRIVRVTIQF